VHEDLLDHRRFQDRSDDQFAGQMPVVYDSSWPDVSGPIVGRVTCQFDRQVCGIEIDFA